GNIENVSVQFKVGKDWVAENAVDPSTVTLAHRADGGEWEELETTPVGEDAENYYFSAASTGLSTFATVAVSMSLQCQAVCVSGEWSECMNGEQSRIAMSCDENYKCVPHVEKRKCGVEEQPSVPKLPLDIIIIPVIGLAVGSYLIFSRKRF
ncbi:MAG: PGF-pre-PGF domain-containing protein, partial [Candidatus Aenigmatarchaeota archaeon]